MASSGMLRRVALVGTDVSEELSAFIIKVTRISELGTTLAIISNRRTKAACVGCCLLFADRTELRGPESASELYRLIDRHLSTKFSANFCG
jgi:hypothetical protein